MVFSAGQVLTASGLNGVTPTAVASYTPTWGNVGTATFTTNTGWYFAVGTQFVFMTAYAVVNAAGSGSSNVTVTAPTSIYRGTRQCVPVDCEAIGSPADIRSGYAVAFTGGSGAVFDRIKLVNANTSGESNLTGAVLAASGILVVTGWYRQT